MLSRYEYTTIDFIIRNITTKIYSITIRVIYSSYHRERHCLSLPGTDWCPLALPREADGAPLKYSHEFKHEPGKTHDPKISLPMTTKLYSGDWCEENGKRHQAIPKTTRQMKVQKNVVIS